MSDPLKPFKIADQHKPTVDKRPAAKSQEGTPVQASAGFPHIEALVESAAPSLEGLIARHAQLEEMATAKGSAKAKANAKKAAAAYGVARTLIDYLLETKQKMTGA
jgi:hypothetical protein